MIVVGGVFEVDPTEREAFIADRVAMIRRSRAEGGCLEYTFAPDPIEPGRVVLYERWTDQAALDAHLAALRSDPPSPGAADQGVEQLDHPLRRQRRTTARLRLGVALCG